MKPPPQRALEGLTVWFKNHPGTGRPPTLIALTPGRSLTEREYGINSKLLFVPDLATALPAVPSRVGDRWRVPAVAAAALLGGQPQRGDALIATLVNLQQTKDGSATEALIRVSGRAMLPMGETLLNAQIVFAFAPAPAPAPPADERKGTAVPVVDARGAITEVRLARSTVAGIPGSNGRLKRTITWELVLQRDLKNPGDMLDVPTPAPAENPENSWLTLEDPKGRFHFRHPQSLALDTSLPLVDSVQLVGAATGGPPERVFTLQLQSKANDPQTERNNRDPEFHLKSLAEEWAKNHQDVVRGPHDWLPEADWQPYKMKVYRIEAAIKLGGGAASPPGDSQRVYFTYYLVLTTQNQSLVVTAMTTQDPPQPYTALVEDILKTYKPGPPARPAG